MQGGQPAEIWPAPVYRPLLAAAAVVKAHEVQPMAGAAWWILMPSPCKSFDTGLLPAPATASVSTSSCSSGLVWCWVPNQPNMSKQNLRPALTTLAVVRDKICAPLQQLDAWQV